MGLSRLLTLVALGFVAYLAWIRIRAWLTRPKPPEGTGEPSRRMLRCHRCGLFVPEDEAVRDSRGHVYCSREHRELSANDSDT